MCHTRVLSYNWISRRVPMLRILERRLFASVETVSAISRHNYACKKKVLFTFRFWLEGVERGGGFMQKYISTSQFELDDEVSEDMILSRLVVQYLNKYNLVSFLRRLGSWCYYICDNKKTLVKLLNEIFIGNLWLFPRWL